MTHQNLKVLETVLSHHDMDYYAPCPGSPFRGTPLVAHISNPSLKSCIHPRPRMVMCFVPHSHLDFQLSFIRSLKNIWVLRLPSAQIQVTILGVGIKCFLDPHIGFLRPLTKTGRLLSSICFVLLFCCSGLHSMLNMAYKL